MQNLSVITGNVSNIKTRETKVGSLTTGWFTQRAVSAFANGEHDRLVHVVSLPIVIKDAAVAADLAKVGADSKGVSMPVKISGRLVSTRFGQGEDAKFVTQIDVAEVTPA